MYYVSVLFIFSKNDIIEQKKKTSNNNIALIKLFLK